jgi:methyltransferase (TIGR00027 family)
VLFYLDIKLPGIFNEIVARTRYIDDQVIRSINEGMTQLVIMGAGYDTRAHRIPKIKEKMRPFEIDHPMTQRLKIRRLNKLFGKMSDHVTYVPVDFEKQTMRNALNQSGYDSSQKTLFIWEGVSMYITPEAVDEALSFVVTYSGKGSGIIFNYCFQSLVDGKCTLFGAEKFRKYVMKKEEPILFGIEEGKAESFLKNRGFGHVKDVTGKELQQLYFTSPNSDRRLPEFGGIVYATV